MIIQYGACFGTELAMNNQLATHFRVYFQMPGGQAAALAGCFGLMNLFARSLGGIFSDALFSEIGIILDALEVYLLSKSAVPFK